MVHLKNGVIIIIYYYNVTSLYSSGGLRPPHQSMIQTLLFVMMICIRLADEVVSKVNYMG